MGIVDLEPLQDLENKQPYSKPSSPPTRDNIDCLSDNNNDIVALEPLQEIENTKQYSECSPPSTREDKSCLSDNPDDTDVKPEKSSTSLSILTFDHEESIPVQYYDDNTFENVEQYPSIRLKDYDDQYNIFSDFELHFGFVDKKLQVQKADNSDSNYNNLNENLFSSIESNTGLATVTVDNIGNELLVFFNDNVFEDNRKRHIPCDSNVTLKDTINTADVSGEPVTNTSIDSNGTKETINEKKSFGKFTSRLQKLSFPNVGHSLTPDFGNTSNGNKPSANQDSPNPINSSTTPVGGGKSFAKSFVTLKNIGNKWKQQIVAGNTNELGSSLDTKTIDGSNQTKQQSGF